MARGMKIIGVVALAVAITGCGGGSDEGLRIEGAWARATPGGATNGAAYMTITSGEGDRLIGATAPAEVAAVTEIHETVMVDDSAGDDHGDDGHGMDGAMTMQQVEAIELPEGEEVALEPGGYHVMLLDLVEPLAPGDTFELTLEFAEAGTEIVEIEIRLDAP